MNDIFLRICNFLYTVLNPIIGIVAIVEVVLTFICFYKLPKRKIEISSLTGESSEFHQTARKSGRGKVTTTRVITIERDWGEYDGFRKRYQNSLLFYNIFTLIIQLFPLLGILGTVAGLYIALNVRDSAASLYSGVGFALSSTVLGILAAIAFKILDVFLSGIVNGIDDNIDRYEKNYTVETQEAQGGAPSVVTPPAVAKNTSTRREQ